MGTEENVKTLSFSISGEFITTLAREKCYYEGDFIYAMDLLTSSMVSDEVSKDEITNMAIAILDGRAELHGTYPNEDYGFDYLDEKNDKWDFGKLIAKLYSDAKNEKKEYKDLIQKYLFIFDNISESERQSLNREYKNEYDENLFD